MARRRRSLFSQFRSLTRNLKTIVSSLIGLGLVGSIGYFSWDGFFAKTKTEPAKPAIVVEMPPKSAAEIKIGTFNIENFGKSQLSSAEVMATIAEIAMGFDVLAIQEISAKNGNALHELVAKMNEAEPDRFDYLVSPLLGKTPTATGSDTEQFGFVYDTTRIELVDKKYYGFVLSEKRFRNKFNRLPVVSSFRVKPTMAANPFTFSLVTFHNVPDRHDRWEAETASIREVYQEVRSVLGAEDDIILLGDFNADHEKLKASLAPLQRKFTTAVTIEKTNLKQTKSYDNLVFDPELTTEFIAGQVLDFRQICEKYQADPESVSDHFPVIGVFGIEENGKSRSVAAKKDLNSQSAH